MLDGIGRRMRMSKLLGVPAVLVQLLIVVDFVVEGGIVDVQFVRVDSYDWSFSLLSTFPTPSGERILPYSSCIFWITHGYWPPLIT